MALVKCKECGGQVSTSAKACPACGAKPPRKTSLTTWIIGGVTLVAAYKCASVGEDAEADRQRSIAEARKLSDAMSPEQRKAAEEEQARAAAEKVAKELEFQRAVRIAQVLKAGMKNPASFELTSLLRTNDGALCFEYRGTNSFNAVVPSYAVVPPKGRPVSGGERAIATAWNAHCAHKPGEDMTHVRHAL